jgi:tryptophan synthase alpha chain
MLPEAGADFVEIGIPFSDPLADGPVIQHSTHVALERGMTVSGVLSLIREAKLEVPVIAFGYLNPILAYGLDRFIDDAVASGISGLLLTDLPADEDEGIERKLHESPLDLIRLVAPTTETERLTRTVASAQGFIYLISRLGVTGAKTAVGSELSAAVDRVRAATSLPISVGFGIANGEQAARVAGMCEGVVVGSALVKRLDQGLESARDLMRELATALENSSNV